MIHFKHDFFSMNGIARNCCALVLSLGVMVPLAAPGRAIEPDAPSRLISTDDIIGFELQQKLNNFRGELSRQEQAERKALVEFYANRGNQPVWVEAKGLNKRAQSVMAQIRNAGEWALPASAFKLPNTPAAQMSAGNLASNVLANAEITLSLAVLKYARYARGGRTIPLKISNFLDRKPDLIDPRKVIKQISTSADPVGVIRGFHPTHPQFLALLKQYKAMTRGAARQANEPNQPKLPTGPTLKKGVTHANVAILRKRLKLAATGEPEQQKLFDGELERAVRAFQRKEGLEVDGVVGPGTRRVLNGGQVRGDPKKLLVNIEQWRWMPSNLGSMYIWVNIPEYRIRVVKNNKVIHAERVVVGKKQNQTPVFSKNMKWIEFHPSWYIPTSIKVAEIGPNVRSRGTSFLNKMNMVMECPGGAYGPTGKNGSSRSVPAGVDIAKCAVRQLPGPTNVLGKVKFKFPNKHSVYLHDTTSKSLFGKRVRTYSHGCVRVRDPIKLAEIILANDQNMSKRKIRSIVNGPVSTYQAFLKKDLPVHVTYFTAVADASGKINYFRDVYGHEKRIALAMSGNYSKISPVYVSRTPLQVAKRKIRRRPEKNLFEQIFGGLN